MYSRRLEKVPKNIMNKTLIFSRCGAKQTSCLFHSHSTCLSSNSTPKPKNQPARWSLVDHFLDLTENSSEIPLSCGIQVASRRQGTLLGAPSFPSLPTPHPSLSLLHRHPQTNHPSTQPCPLLVGRQHLSWWSLIPLFVGLWARETDLSDAR